LSPDNARRLPCRSVRIVILPAAILLLAAADVPGVVVQQFHRAFSLSLVSIVRGGTITFSNVDEFDHEVYVDSPNFNYDSFEQLPGDKAVVTFSSAGSFEVRCHIHPKMHLHVDVVER
jgi:plastocyanin